MKNNTIEAKAKEWRKEVELSFTKRIAIIKKYKLLSDEEFDERVIEIYLEENPEVKQDEMADAETGESKPSHLVINIVNGLYELAGLSPEKRHILNDRADEFVADVLAKEQKEAS